MIENITNNPSVPTQVVAEVKFPQFINNLGIIPTSYKDSMSYYETLAWLCKYLEETVIPTVNQNGNAVQELQALYIQLNNYVTHYFDNLDVQEEINNKLDEMVESGELQTLINNYLQLTKIYNNLEELKEDTTLINSAKVKILGLDIAGDGGECEFIITNELNENDYQVLLDNGLYANLIKKSKMRVECFGINENIDISKLIEAINFSRNNGITLLLGYKTYNLNESIELESANRLKIEGVGRNSKINYIGNSYVFIIHTGDRFEFSNFQIECNNSGSAFQFINTETPTTQHCSNLLMNNIEINNSIKCLEMNVHCGYIDFNNCSFKTSNIDGIIFDFTNSYLPEYVTIRHCDFSNPNYRALTNNSKFLILNNGIFFNIYDNDIIGFNKAFDFSAPTYQLHTINLYNNSFFDIEENVLYIKGGESGRIQNIIIENSLVQIKERTTTNNIFVTTGTTYGITIKNICCYLIDNPSSYLKLSNVVGGYVENISSNKTINQANNTVSGTSNVKMLGSIALTTVNANSSTDITIGNATNIVNFKGYILSKRGGGDLSDISVSNYSAQNGTITMTLTNASASNIGVNIVGIYN